jgi:hypothetical protein
LNEGTLEALADAAAVRPEDLSHRVDPQLVAGVRVLTARGLVDLSAAGLAAQSERLLIEQLERERESLNDA